MIQVILATQGYVPILYFILIFRNYVSMDIIRRILQGYFGYKVNFVQNVTDIDDKVSGHNSVAYDRL